jgi:hypothetical protein
MAASLFQIPSHQFRAKGIAPSPIGINIRVQGTRNWLFRGDCGMALRARRNTKHFVDEDPTAAH